MSTATMFVSAIPHLTTHQRLVASRTADSHLSGSTPRLFSGPGTALARLCLCASGASVQTRSGGGCQHRQSERRPCSRATRQQPARRRMNYGACLPDAWPLPPESSRGQPAEPARPPNGVRTKIGTLHSLSSMSSLNGTWAEPLLECAR